ncbi:MAG: hypothetical protein ACRCZ9_08925 [Fusobacteriaceae bacterium]
MEDFKILIGKTITCLGYDEDGDAVKIYTNDEIYNITIIARAAGGQSFPMWFEGLDERNLDSILNKEIVDCWVEQSTNSEEGCRQFDVRFTFIDGSESDRWSILYTLDTYTPVISINHNFLGIEKL